ncbi:Holin of 3TMs, for gene-transfer release [Pseudovibrio denitrificans]|uniref:Holin of 3TMs, for gene-transfer release n=1 Tax=Pseudovibrio denitrificans TaxID=258256 RepID=A0A1I6ZX55_9HYPH|nr:3TM-type holin [Pseudovibrio denitrificans]SFT67252.1 Holin of 3TMs, for gene-transfer release [Pseudovibrio denitrificans]
MALHALVPILISVGAPLLGELVSQVAGDPAGKIATNVVSKIAEGIGVDPTPEAIVTEFERDPEGVAPVIRAVEEEDKSYLVEMLSSINTTMRAEAKARGLLTRIWRPIFGILFSVVYFLLGLALIYVLVTAADPLAVLGVLSGFLVTYLLTGASVLGVYVWKRTDEKIRQVT